MKEYMNRRDFLKIGAATGASLGITAQSGGKSRAQSVRWGIIGVGSRGTHLMRVAMKAPDIEIAAVCDINENHLNRAIDIVSQASGRRPEGFQNGPYDYRRMLERNDIDAVLVSTPMQLHAAMSIDALLAGKHVLSEVAAAVTIDECWGLVRAAERSGKVYMMAENCCYYPANMMILEMIGKGKFGELTYSECGYVHDCRFILFDKKGSLTWRGELARDFIGNWYPTHSLGPVCQWLNINRGDRLESLVSFSTKETGISHYIRKKFSADAPANDIHFACGDSNTSLIRTANGAVIDLRFDTQSPKPHPSTTHFTLQGTGASYEDRNRIQNVWIDGQSEKFAWESLENYSEEYEHPLWRKWGKHARQSGHGGADFFSIHEFQNAIQLGSKPPIDVYDAAAWSSIIPLSALSVLEGGKVQEIPDFTKGKWKV